MEEPTELTYDANLGRIARQFAYPATPDVASAVRQRIVPAPLQPTAPRPPAPRRTAWAVALATIALAVLTVLAVPQTRALVTQLLYRIGAVRVFVTEPTPTAQPVATGSAVATAETSGAAVAPGTTTPIPHGLLAIVPGREVALNEASERAGFPVLIPDENSEFGVPDAAVLHPVMGQTMVTLVWYGDDEARRPRLSLSQMPFPDLAVKMARGEQVREVEIDGRPGLWVGGPHQLQLSLDNFDPDVVLASNVLLWTEGDRTFRLEGDMDMATAVRLATELMTHAE